MIISICPPFDIEVPIGMLISIKLFIILQREQASLLSFNLGWNCVWMAQLTLTLV
jgi:hypothetical protein